MHWPHLPPEMSPLPVETARVADDGCPLHPEDDEDDTPAEPEPPAKDD